MVLQRLQKYWWLVIKIFVFCDSSSSISNCFKSDNKSLRFVLRGICFTVLWIVSHYGYALSPDETLGVLFSIIVMYSTVLFLMWSYATFVKLLVWLRGYLHFHLPTGCIVSLSYCDRDNLRVDGKVRKSLTFLSLSMGTTLFVPFLLRMIARPCIAIIKNRPELQNGAL